MIYFLSIQTLSETNDVPSVYDDDSGTDLNAKITKKLTMNIPYMIVYSKCYLSNSGTIGIKLKIH